MSQVMTNGAETMLPFLLNMTSARTIPAPSDPDRATRPVPPEPTSEATILANRVLALANAIRDGRIDETDAMVIKALVSTFAI